MKSSESKRQCYFGSAAGNLGGLRCSEGRRSRANFWHKNQSPLEPLSVHTPACLCLTRSGNQPENALDSKLERQRFVEQRCVCISQELTKNLVPFDF